MRQMKPTRKKAPQSIGSVRPVARATVFGEKRMAGDWWCGLGGASQQRRPGRIAQMARQSFCLARPCARNGARPTEKHRVKRIKVLQRHPLLN